MKFRINCTSLHNTGVNSIEFCNVCSQSGIYNTGYQIKIYHSTNNLIGHPWVCKKCVTNHHLNNSKPSLIVNNSPIKNWINFGSDCHFCTTQISDKGYCLSLEFSDQTVLTSIYMCNNCHLI